MAGVKRSNWPIDTTNRLTANLVRYVCVCVCALRLFFSHFPLPEGDGKGSQMREEGTAKVNGLNQTAS